MAESHWLAVRNALDAWAPTKHATDLAKDAVNQAELALERAHAELRNCERLERLAYGNYTRACGELADQRVRSE